jgi:hypothetical protein
LQNASSVSSVCLFETEETEEIGFSFTHKERHMILYHFTGKENLESIYENGLVPAIGKRSCVGLTLGRPVVWLTIKPAPTWMIGVPDNGEIFMLTVDAKRGKHLHRWIPWLREHEGTALINGRLIRITGEEVIEGLDRTLSDDGPFTDNRGTDKENYYISTAVIHPKRIIKCAQVKFVRRPKAEDAA